MARYLTFAVALAAWAIGAGCTATSYQGTVDGGVTTPDAQGDVFTEDSGPNACTDGSVRLVRASDYDQSCTVDTDCRVIAEGNACVPCAFECALGGAINVSALTKYKSDVAGTPAVAVEFNGQTCASGCPAAFGPCCVNGKCEKLGAAGQCPDTRADASADAAPDPCGGCGQGQQCVQLRGSTTSVCAGAHCGTSTADGGACPAGQTCRAVSYDPCPPPPPGQAQCNIASVTYDACVSGATDAGAD